MAIVRSVASATAARVRTVVIVKTVRAVRAKTVRKV
jgi:hypothetical protein